MTTKKFHRNILLSSFVICLFIYTDAHYVPINTVSEKLVSKTYAQDNLSKYRSNIFTLVTNNSKLTVAYDLYSIISVGDTISIERSALTKLPQEISVTQRNFTFRYRAGFAKAGFGLYAVPLVISLIILFFIFYDKVGNVAGKKRLTFVLLTLSLLLLFFYFRA